MKMAMRTNRVNMPAPRMLLLVLTVAVVFLVVEAASTYTPPYENGAFQEFLLGSRLHCPHTSPSATSRDGFKTYSNEHFFLDSNDNMVLSYEEDSGRCELRHNKYFGMEPTVMKARVRVQPPPTAGPEDEELNTIFQIHAKDLRPDYAQGPFCRVVWSRGRNEIHAVVRQNLLAPGEKRVNKRFQIQSPLPTDFFDFELGFYDIDGNMEFRIYYNGELRHRAVDMSFYAPVATNYFKTGMYKHQLGGSMEYQTLNAYFAGDPYFSDPGSSPVAPPTEAPVAPTGAPVVPTEAPVAPTNPPITDMNRLWIILFEETFDDPFADELFLSLSSNNANVATSFSVGDDGHSLALFDRDGMATTRKPIFEPGSYDEFRLSLQYYPINGIDRGEGIRIQRFDGSNWLTIQSIQQNMDKSAPDQWYHWNVTWPADLVTEQVRLVCDFTATDEIIYVNNVALAGSFKIPNRL